MGGGGEKIGRAAESVTPVSAQGHYFSYFLTIRLDARCLGRGARALLEVRRRGKHPAAIVWSPLNKRRYHRESGSPASPGFTYRRAVPRRRVVSRRVASGRLLRSYLDPTVNKCVLLLLLLPFHPLVPLNFSTALGHANPLRWQLIADHNE